MNDEDIRFLQNLSTAVKTGDEISIVPAIAGGVSPPPSSPPRTSVKCLACACGRLYYACLVATPNRTHEPVMHAIKKLQRNFLSSRAVSVLGLGQYARYLACLAANSAKVMRGGDLRAVDRAMGRKTERFHYYGSDFLFDCRFCDERIQDNSYAFGIAREIYIRDCYFKHQPRWVYDHARTVLDVGANRGAFSVLMAGRAQKVVSIEALPEFEAVIRHNMERNGYSNFAIEVCFVGAGGMIANPHSRSFTIPEMLDRHAISQLDFMKMDIEGSEFALFASPDWLARVNALSMEVHPECGDPTAIITTLKQHGFQVTATDENLEIAPPGSDPKVINFIYACR